MVSETPEQDTRGLERRSFGEMLRDARRARKFSQAGLAKAVGISAVHVSQVETAQRIPSDRVAKEMALVLGLPWQDVLRAVYRLRSREADELFARAKESDSPSAPLISEIPAVRFLLLQLAGLNLSPRDVEALVRNWSSDLALITQLSRAEGQ